MFICQIICINSKFFDLTTIRVEETFSKKNSDLIMIVLCAIINLILCIDILQRKIYCRLFQTELLLLMML